MCETIRYMDTEGLKYGYQRHRAKGTYLLGRCRSLADAKFRKEFLVEEFGMYPTRIQIHPDNIQESGDEDEYKKKKKKKKKKIACFFRLFENNFKFLHSNFGL